MSKKILFVASEVYPLIKTGGLADVAGALPAALADTFDVRVLLPHYPQMNLSAKACKQICELGDPFGFGPMRLLRADHGKVKGRYWLLDCPALFERAGGPYLDESGLDHADNHRRFAALSWAGAVLAQYGHLLGWQPDLVHAHDWQTGLLPAYLAAWQQRRPATVFTIHNLQYTGRFPADTWPEIGLPAAFYTPQGLEYYGDYAMLKAGIVYSDAVTTVSPTYAAEIQTPAFGHGLDGLLQAHRDKLSGLLNGIDGQEWDPAHDRHLKAGYDVENPAGKLQNKRALQKHFGLSGDAGGPLFGVVSRLSEQKGLDLVLATLPALIDAGGQLVLLGSGDAALAQAFSAMAAQYPGQVAVHLGYNEPLAHRIQAGCDFLLVPSRFEPCGLTQMYAMRYGTLPIVRRTGGLADSVRDGETGLVFDAPEAWDLLAALHRAHALYAEPDTLHRLRTQAMQEDFSWQRAAFGYRQLYQRLLGD